MDIADYEHNHKDGRIGRIHQEAQGRLRRHEETRLGYTFEVLRSYAHYVIIPFSSLVRLLLQQC